MASDGVKIYYYPISQPSRSILLFLKAANIPHIEKVVDMDTDEHNSPEFVAMNPFHSLPVIVDDGFTIVESVASAKHLARTKNVDDHWYPKDPKKRARVDEYLAWQHTGIRAASNKVLMKFLLEAAFSGKPVPEEDKDAALKAFGENLGSIESYFLKDKPFIVGDDITIADIFAVSEIQQAMLSKRDYLKGHPKIKEWIERVKSKTNPHYDAVFEKLTGLTATLGK